MQLVGVMILLLAARCAFGKSDYDALLEFRNGIKENPEGRLVSSWSPQSLPEPGGCPSEWYGVQCSSGRIISITLSGMNLAGEVNLSALTSMEMLINLSLSHNRLSGIVLPESRTFRSLELLDLSDNSFAGEIPAGLSRIESLVYLNLSSNNFSGTLPSGLKNLRKLAYFDLRGNEISGDIERCLLELQAPVRVDFSRNAFTGSLRSVPENSSLLSSIQYLNISHNRISGELFPDLMPLFDSLEVFDAGNNELQGPIPSFNFIVSLRVLRLQNNLFSGPLPEAFLKESSMTLGDLDLSNNQLEGPIGSITSTTLRILNIPFNKLTGVLPLRVGSCAAIDLAGNRISGNLSRISNWGNYVETIDLSSNSLEGMLPNDTSLFLRLVSLKVSNNSLHGELPAMLGSYPELQTVDFSLNKVHGSLPPSLFTTLRLAEMNLSGNNITGSIPLPSAMNFNLVSLDLSENSLGGSLPPEIGDLKALKLLNLGGNNFSGMIPPTISNLQSLTFLDLSGNNLEGGIPGGMPDHLTAFNVSYNNLSGIVPANLLGFPDASFHPGNSMLILPLEASANGDEERRGHGHRLKPLIRNVMIAGLAGAVFVVILLSLMIYYWSSLARGRGKSADQSKLPAATSKEVEEGLPPASSEPDKSSAKSAGKGLPDQIRSGQQSPLSLFSSSPYSREENPSEQPPSIFMVRSPDKLMGDLHLLDSSFVFTAEELSRAPAEIIGRSYHGTTYRATLDGGHVLAVKWLREGITKGKKDFSREAKKLGNVKHPNVIALRGYYWGPKEHERLIISDYVNAECLTAHLCEFERRKMRPLSLGQRLGIAIDAARGLNYLHNQRAIPHGNLKSTNILIVSPQTAAMTLTAMLSDYSLHRLMNPAGMADQVLNAGALGYRPPEFACTSKPCPSLKSDVYAFGVILLELLTGKNAGEIASGDPSLVDLTDWVKLLAGERRSSECFDRVIMPDDAGCEEGSVAIMEGILQVALRCIRPALERPEMATVFDDLRALAASAPPTLYMAVPPG